MTYAAHRQRLVEELRSLGITQRNVLEAFSRVPREAFVDVELRSRAYENRPLPIGEGQTISQPYTVARMMELLDPRSEDVVLEIGTGSGYQTALLASIVKSVYTIERIPSLANRARNMIKDLQLNNIVSIIGDGTKGLPDYEPYDGIIVTAGATKIPEAYFDQMADGGRLVIPVGEGSVQRMVRVLREGDVFSKEEFGEFLFVPLIEGEVE